MCMALKLNPEPLSLKVKPRGPKKDDLIPVDSSFQLTDLSKEQCCGVLVGGGVAVTDPQHIWTLVQLACYGKGVFSRSVPCHQHIPSLDEMKQVSRKRKVKEDDASEEVEVSWKKRMRLHFQWREVATEDKTGTALPVVESKTKEPVGEHQTFVDRLTAIKKDDPYHIEEYLQLGAEEAYYLVAEAKVLRVVNDKAVVLTENELWVHFSQLNHSFPARYAAYAHYKAGNWVPKSGLKFGVDFLLYKESPFAYHSSFAVVVKEEFQGDDKCRGEQLKGRGLTWREVIAQDRVSESAGKDLLICHVTKPEGTMEDMSREPHCMNLWIIEDVIIKRWIPEQDREI